MIGLLFILLGIFLYFVTCIYSKKNSMTLQEVKRETIIPAILIPARNESKVIHGLLESIEKQTVSIDKKDVYVIVESKEDPTVSMVETWGGTVLYRTDLTKHRKGYALDEAIKQILERNLHYDFYVIMDADNSLHDHFLEEMIACYQKGYDITVGCRCPKNANESIVSACSFLTFTMINTVSNKSKVKHQGNVTISGTGFYIKGTLIEGWNGFPFHTLTEDYELTLYSIVHQLKTFYHKKAIFYDEQPITWEQSKKQRLRWIRGYFDARKQYKKQLRKAYHFNSNAGSCFQEQIGVTPYIIMIIGYVLLLLEILINGIQKPIWLIMILFLFVLLYFILIVITVVLIRKEREHLFLSKTRKLQTLLFHPFFLISYLPVAIKAVTHKNIGWDPIEHHTNEVENGYKNYKKY